MNNTDMVIAPGNFQNHNDLYRYNLNKDSLFDDQKSSNQISCKVSTQKFITSQSRYNNKYEKNEISR